MKITTDSLHTINVGVHGPNQVELLLADKNGLEVGVLLTPRDVSFLAGALLASAEQAAWAAGRAPN